MTTQHTIPIPEQLTEHERAAIYFVQAYSRVYGLSPNFQEIHAELGLSMAATHGLLQRLREWGYLARRWDVHMSRNLCVVREI